MLPKVLEEILIVTTGGTIDKVYFDQKSDYQVGQTIIGSLLNEAQVTHPYRIMEVLQKDSVDLNDADRQTIHSAIVGDLSTLIIVTHGTDTMTDTAQYLSDIEGKTIIITGSLAPARIRVEEFVVHNINNQQKIEVSRLRSTSIKPSSIQVSPIATVIEPP
jgi:L-asparaginase/Glu-tRNA(Gln) amidotransferase subunit D